MKNILLVDDNKYLLDGLSMSLSLYLKNYTIVTAKNGKQAVEMMKSFPADFILTDLQMPVMDGFALIAYVKKNHPATPIFAMTGSYTMDVDERLRALNVVQCFKKPFDFRKLAAMVSGMLENGSCKSPNEPEATAGVERGVPAVYALTK